MRRVLVVDDEPHILRVLKTSLESHGYRIDVARDGAIALELLRHDRYDAVVTDVQMPNMSGQELCERMLAEYPAPLPYTLLVTASTDDALREWVAARTGIEFIEKPVSLRRLRQHLDARLEQTGEADDAAGGRHPGEG